MKSVIVDKVHIKAMLKALREAGAPIQSTSTTHEVKGKNGTIFWAMKGSKKTLWRGQATWLVSHHEKLFI